MGIDVSDDGFPSATVRVAPMANRHARLGQVVAFTCELLEGDGVDFNWYYEGRALSGGERVHIASNPFSSMLTLRGIRAKDGGRYTCLASNSVHEHKSSAMLSVDGQEVYPEI